MIRTYNNHFAFTTIGIRCDERFERRDRGIYTVRVQGQVHHFLDDLMPQDSLKKLTGIQFYFYDSAHQIQNRLSVLPRLDESIVEKLVAQMENNPYTLFLKNASTFENIDNYHIVIRSNPGLDQREYSRPTCSEVAGIWIEDESGENELSEPWDIRVYTKSGSSHKVQYYYACYDPLQYVLMFPNGEPGWHGNIPIVGCTIRSKTQLNALHCNSFEEIIQYEKEGASRSKGHKGIIDPITDSDHHSNRKRKIVSCREYYVYKLQQRENDQSYLLRFGILLQQYVVDNYIKLESMRLAFYTQEKYQKQLRREHYQGIMDSVISGVQHGSKVGKRVYLPATFIGGPRDMRHRYLDSMALVQEYGNPDIFLTITCNPNWVEIKQCLQPGEEAQNRPDLLCRVFRAKLWILHDKIMSGQLFGHVASVVHVVEFQKRGIPHAHFLIILRSSSKYLTPEAYDRIVTAELLDKNEDPYLYSLIVKHMMHEPCGYLNPNNVYMVNGKCKNHFAKEFIDQTKHGKGSYPMYRRRNDGRNAKVRGHFLDNRWVIPYNPTLLAEFNCHLNVEICCDIRAVKYLYKYVHKGHDKVMFRIGTDSKGSNVNEITDFQSARWVSPVEAVWRIYGFALFGMYPAVVQLQVHLPNFQCIQFEDDTNLEYLLQNECLQRTMLTEFFYMNATNEDAKKLNLLYKDFPRYYVWDSQMRVWTKRKKGTFIGRLSTVNPIENERYYLRLLLNNIRCPTSFDSLLSVNGVHCDTFQKSANVRGLLQNDSDIDKTLEEASVYRMPSELRRLFAPLLHYCKPSNPQKLFQTYYVHMAEDLLARQSDLNLSEHGVLNKVLEGINDTLESLGRDINEYKLVSFKFTASELNRLTREIASERSIPVPEEDLIAVNKLNAEQKVAFNLIFDNVMSGKGGAYFIDGPGGTGKSFLYKVLLAHIRSKGYIALIVASSGIAASGFLGGRTAHSRFKIPIDGGPKVRCQLSVQSSEAEMIKSSKIIIWDEAPMSDKSIIHALHIFLQDLCLNELMFGGKLVVFGGDFRQVLPVIPRGSRNEQIDASIVSSTIWNHITKLQLTENMWAKDDPAFIDFLMRIGNGRELTNEKGEIRIPRPMLVEYSSIDQSLEMLIGNVYPNMSLFRTAPFEMIKRTILCPKNEFVDDINLKLIQRLPGDEYVYMSDDRAKSVKDQGDYVDYLNTLEPKGLPCHKLVLKQNSQIILLRNINPIEGLCNGTRLICRNLLPNVVGAEIVIGQHIGKHVWIPKIPLETTPSDNKYLIPFVRPQIPVRLCFAMTINKSRGQTLDYVGLYLKQPVFSHGQLYVGLSRARSGKNVKVLIVPATCNDPGTEYTVNVVYNEVLLKASIR